MAFLKNEICADTLSVMFRLLGVLATMSSLGKDVL